MQFQLISFSHSRESNGPRISSKAEPNDQRLRQAMSTETGFEEREIEDVVDATDFQSEVIAGELTSDLAEVHHCTFLFDPAVDTKILQLTIHAFTDHYTIFRTCFVVHNGKLSQLVLKSAPPFLIRSRNDQENGIYQQDAGPIEREVGPCGRALYLQHVSIYSEGRTTNRVILCISHALFDSGYDGGFLRRAVLELEALYEGETLSRSPPFSEFCSARLSALPAGLKFWKELLRDAEPSRLVAKLSPSDMTVLSSEVICSVDIGPTLPQGTTPATLMKAAWALVLSEILYKGRCYFRQYRIWSWVTY